MSVQVFIKPVWKIENGFMGLTIGHLRLKLPCTYTECFSQIGIFLYNILCKNETGHMYHNFKPTLCRPIKCSLINVYISVHISTNVQMKIVSTHKVVKTYFFTSTVSKLYCWLSRHFFNYFYFAKCTYTSENLKFMNDTCIQCISINFIL